MKIGVLMSGGVDSSYTAYLLQKQGNEVCGFTLLLSDENSELDNRLSISSAKAVCDHLDIDHKILNLTDEFERLVIEPFVDEYLNGKTPNPCVLCNQRIKFDLAMGEILETGFDKVATGHYAIIEEERGKYKLYRGLDKEKEQSYFLWGLSQEVLSSLLFPLGSFEKKTIINWTNDLDLPYEKRESQDICFLRGLSVGDFIRARRDVSGGNIVNEDGVVLGKHDGIVDFTIGSRRGLNLGGMEEPHYVIEINSDKNEVVVGPEEETYKSDIFVSEVNPTYLPMIDVVGEYLVQVRYNSQPRLADVTPFQDNTLEMQFHKSIKSPAPGQSAVFYDDNELIAGGVIDTIMD